MITYCPSQNCEKRTECKRHVVYESLSEERRKTKSIINLERICPENNHSLFIQIVTGVQDA